MALLKHRSKHHIMVQPRLPQESPYVLSDCLRVSQKTISKHNYSISTKKETNNSPKPISLELKPDDRKTNVYNNNNSTETNNAPCRVAVRHKRVLKSSFSRESAQPQFAIPPKRTPREDSQYLEQIAYPVIHVRIRKKVPGQSEGSELYYPVTPRHSPRLAGSSSLPMTPPTPPTPSTPKQDQQRQTQTHYTEGNNDKERHENTGPKTDNNSYHKPIVVRGSMINSKWKQMQEKASKVSYSAKATTDIKDVVKKSSILATTYTSDTATSILHNISSSIPKRNDSRFEKAGLWQNPTGCAKKHIERREVKRSKTSTGHYQDRSDTIISLPRRDTKSARPQRCSTAPQPQQTLTEYDCQTAFNRMEDSLYNDNLLKFQELLHPFSPQDTKRLVNFKETDSTPNIFFRACGLTKINFVKFMLEKCDPDLELRGPFYVDAGHTQYMVTPLWQTAASGSLELVHILKENGADINAASDTGSSPLLAACYMSHVEVATYLVANKANINSCNAKGLSCLMNSVQSLDLVRLMVLNGAEINRADIYGNTPMHFATEEGRLKTLKILFEHGGNPMMVNLEGYNAIQYAAKYRRRDILEYFLQVAHLKVEGIVSAYEMIGAMVIMMEEDIDGGYLYLHKATTLRFLNKHDAISKQTKPSVLAEYENVPEFSSLQELTEIASKPTQLCIQALMIYERHIGSLHDDFRSMLLYCGATFADHYNFKGAANLWRLSYQLNFEKYVQGSDRVCDPFNHNTLKSVAFIVKLLFQWKRVILLQTNSGNGDEPVVVNSKLEISEINVRNILRMLCLHSAIAQTWLNDHPPSFCNRDRDSFIFLVRSILCVILIYVESFSPSERDEEVWQYVKYAISLNPRGEGNETLLHMCLSLATLRHLDLDISNTRLSWPSETVTNIVLILGADPTQCDNAGNTPLHLAAKLVQQGAIAEDDTILQSLLSKGAHADQVNNSGKTAFDLLGCGKGLSKKSDLLQKSVSLKCLAASVIAVRGISYIGEVPTSLYTFIELHRSIKQKT